MWDASYQTLLAVALIHIIKLLPVHVLYYTAYYEHWLSFISLPVPVYLVTESRYPLYIICGIGC